MKKASVGPLINLTILIILFGTISFLSTMEIKKYKVELPPPQEVSEIEPPQQVVKSPQPEEQLPEESNVEEPKVEEVKVEEPKIEVVNASEVLAENKIETTETILKKIQRSRRAKREDREIPVEMLDNEEARQAYLSGAVTSD